MFFDGMNLPYFYNHINVVNSIQDPSTIHAYNTGLTRFFAKYLMERAMSVYKWTLPEEFNQYYFKWVLFTCGYIGIFNNEKFGTMCQWGTFKGYDIYYYPKKLVFTNPAWQNAIERTIGEDCVLLNLKGDFTGYGDIVSFYAEQLAVLYESFGVNALQAKNTDIYGAEDKKIAEELKKTTDLVMSGKPAVFVSKELFNEDGSLNCTQFKSPKDYFGTELLANIREILNNFDADVGIATPPEKRERLISNEVDAQASESQTRAEMYLEDLKTECKKAREMFGINIDVDFRYNIMEQKLDMTNEGGEENVTEL